MIFFKESLKSDWILAEFNELLDPICDAIENTIIRIEEIPEKTEAIYKDLLIDDECGKIESLIGLSFVVCQISITGFVSTIIKLYSNYLSEYPEKNGAILVPSKRELLKISDGICIRSKKTKVQIMDAFANYYKHQDEWGYNWDNPIGPSKATIELLRLEGIKSGSTGNFRDGARILGNTKYTDGRVYRTILKEWIDSVGKKITEDLGIDLD